MVMSNVLSREKREQVIALGRLGWSLRRIEQATGVRRGTAGEYLRGAGMYLEGVSTRKVRAVTEALYGLEVSKSQVSAGTARLDEETAQWRERSLEKTYPYLMVDARHEKVRRRGAVVSQGC